MGNVSMVLELFPKVRDRPEVAGNPCQDPCLRTLTEILQNKYGVSRGPWVDGIAQNTYRHWMDDVKLYLPSMLYRQVYIPFHSKMRLCLKCQLNWKLWCGCIGFRSC